MDELINNIMRALENCTYTYVCSDRYTRTHEQRNVIDREHLPYVRVAIVGELANVATQIGTLEAKVKAYESIIANSNFAVAIDKKEEHPCDADGQLKCAITQTEYGN